MNTTSAVLLLVGLFAVIFTLSVPIGIYMSAVFDGTLSQKFPWMYRVESIFLWPLGKSGREPMDWKEYCVSLIALTVVGTVIGYLIFRFQGYLPYNPLNFKGLAPDLAFNTAVSFSTSTTWQGYDCENVMSLFSQAFGVCTLTFLSSSTGVVAAFAFARGLIQSRDPSLGNAWEDMVRCVLWLFLPLAVICSIIAVWQGCTQTFDAMTVVKTIEGPIQKIAVGPVASQAAIRVLAVTGGGFFSANSAHPFAAPTAVVCMIQIILMLLMAASLVFAYGRMTGNVKSGFSILFGMMVLFIGAFMLIAWSESTANPLVTELDVSHGLGNMEGKEVRFGTLLTSLFATGSSASAAGSSAGSFDSMMPIGGGVSLWLIQVGDVIFGGSRSGLYTMLGLAIVAVFILGMLVGKTPRYLGKRIDAYDMKMVCVSLLMPSICTLIGTAIACLTPQGVDAVSAPGPHGFTQILFAFSSVSNFNGSSFGGLAANDFFYNTALAICMWICRMVTLTALLAIAGNMASKPRQMNSVQAIQTDGPVFSFMFIMVAVLLSMITFFPAQSLGPIVESIQLFWGYHS